MKPKNKSYFILLAATAFILLNVPFLFIANHPGAILGVPILFVYILTIWTLLIIVSFIFIQKFHE